MSDRRRGPAGWSGGARVCEAGVPPRVGLVCPRCVRPVCPPGDGAVGLLNRKFRGDWAGYVRPVCPSSGLHGE